MRTLIYLVSLPNQAILLKITFTKGIVIAGLSFHTGEKKGVEGQKYYGCEHYVDSYFAYARTQFYTSSLILTPLKIAL